jgi:hypothetical protein
MILSTVQETARCQIDGMQGMEAICRATTYYLRGCGREMAELIEIGPSSEQPADAYFKKQVLQIRSAKEV